MIYQDTNFKIYLSLYGWKENILTKQHIVHWCISVSQAREGYQAHSVTAAVGVWGWRTVVGPPGVSFLLPITMGVNAEFSIELLAKNYKNKR